MFTSTTYNGRGLKLTLTSAEADALAVMLARSQAAVASHHRLRAELLPVLSEFAWGLPDKWQLIPGAILPDGTIFSPKGRGPLGGQRR